MSELRSASEAAPIIAAMNEQVLPLLLTADEVATLLRTTPKAVYCMVERGQLPGVIRLGRRLLFRRRDLVDYLDRKCAPSPKESRR